MAESTPDDYQAESSDLPEWEKQFDSPDAVLAYIRELCQSWPNPEEFDLYHHVAQISILWEAMYRMGWSVPPHPEMNFSIIHFFADSPSPEDEAFVAEQWRLFHEALNIAEARAKAERDKLVANRPGDRTGKANGQTGNTADKPSDEDIQRVRDVRSNRGLSVKQRTIQQELRNRHGSGVQGLKLTKILDKFRKAGEYNGPGKSAHAGRMVRVHGAVSVIPD